MDTVCPLSFMVNVFMIVNVQFIFLWKSQSLHSFLPSVAISADGDKEKVRQCGVLVLDPREVLPDGQCSTPGHLGKRAKEEGDTRPKGERRKRMSGPWLEGTEAGQLTGNLDLTPLLEVTLRPLSL